MTAVMFAFVCGNHLIRVYHKQNMGSLNRIWEILSNDVNLLLVTYLIT
jgi:hypothetical protein